MIYLLFIALTFFTHLGWAESPSCKANTGTLELMRPQSIVNFVNINKEVKSPAELMCCLVKQDPNMQIVVMNNSNAGQNGTPSHPRVLVVKTNKAGDQLDSVFSINSGASHLMQPNSVEMINYTQKSDEMTLHDFDFSHKPMKNHMNPQLCIGCHGSNGQVQKIGGPKPLFDRDPWTRVTDKSFKQHGACPNYAKKIDGMRAESLEALKNNPQYACVKDLPQMSVITYDRLISKRNETRIAKIVSMTKDFKKFKYALAATAVCGGDFKPEDYFPPHQMMAMTNTDSIGKKINGMTAKKELLAYANAPNEMTNEAIKIDSAMAYDPNKNPNMVEDLKTCRQPSALPEERFTGNNTVFHKYIADTVVRRADRNMGFFRYLFESRGIDIADWNTNPKVPYGRAPDMISVLEQATHNDAEMAQLLKSRDCASLKKKSLAAFGPAPRYTDEELNSETGTKVQ